MNLLQPTRAMSREADKRIKQVNQSVGCLSDKLGDFVEKIVRPARRAFVLKNVVLTMDAVTSIVIAQTGSQLTHYATI